MRKVLLVAMLSIALPGCGTTPSTHSTATSLAPTTSKTAPATTTAPPTAFDQLSAFISAAGPLYSSLRSAVDAINATGPPWPSVTSAIQSKVPAHSTLDALAPTIPAGIPSSLLQPALLVYSDLYSGVLGLRRFGTVTTTIPLDEHGQFPYFVGLHNTETALLRFPDDVAHLQALAKSEPTFTVPPSTSQATADLLIYKADIASANEGCGSVGGYLYTVLPTITWKHTVAPSGYTTDASLNWPDGRHVDFRATLTNGAWRVQILAC